MTVAASDSSLKSLRATVFRNVACHCWSCGFLPLVANLSLPGPPPPSPLPSCHFPVAFSCGRPLVVSPFVLPVARSQPLHPHHPSRLLSRPSRPQSPPPSPHSHLVTAVTPIAPPSTPSNSRLRSPQPLPGHSTQSSPKLVNKQPHQLKRLFWPRSVPRLFWVDTCVCQARCDQTDRTSLHVAHDNLRTNAPARRILRRLSDSFELVSTEFSPPARLDRGWRHVRNTSSKYRIGGRCGQTHN